MLTTPKRAFADKIRMQHRLFAELSTMFGREVPLYDKSLHVNRLTNETVCELLSRKYGGFSLTAEQLEKASGERHGAIRVGTWAEYGWVAGFFAAFAMLPHGFYDMTSLGAKSQPIIATAFRSPHNPEHRVFTSLLMIDYFAPEVASRIEQALSRREIFSERAQELIMKNEQEGGLSEEESEELIAEGTSRIFRWTGQAHDHDLYKELSEAGFKIAADIACFESHHLNHLTPNTLCMDLYTAAMKHCLGELDAEAFTGRAARALDWLREASDRDYMRLHFRHLSPEEIEAFAERQVAAEDVADMAAALTGRLAKEGLDLRAMNHSGFKDFTEGPPVEVPVLLRQDAYKALTEPVTFREKDGTAVDTVHTARFGEIEQRFYATTPKGRALYDECLLRTEEARAKDPDLVKRDFAAYQASHAAAFGAFPRTLSELLRDGLVYGRYTATEKGTQAAGSLRTTDRHELVEQGYLRREGLRYEDFLPFSAAGIFASNLGQYGTKSTAAEKPEYSKELLEDIMARTIIEPDVLYHAMEAESLLEAYKDLALLEQLPPAELGELRSAGEAYRDLSTS